MAEEVEGEELVATAHALLAKVEALVADGLGASGLEEALSHRAQCKRAGDVVAEAVSLQAACLAYYDQWRLEECLAAAREAQLLFERAGQVAGQAEVLSTIARVRLATGEGHATAKRAAQRARQLFLEAGPEHEHAALEALLLEVQAHINVLLEHPVHVHTADSWAEALKSASEAEDLARGLEDLPLAASALCLQVQVHGATQRGQAAMRAARSAAALYQRLGGPADAARALLLGAEAAQSSRRRKEARQLAVEALALARTLGDEAMEDAAKAAVEAAGGEGKDEEALVPDAGEPTLSTQLALSMQDGSARPLSISEVMQKVLNLDLVGAPREETPILELDAPQPLRAPRHEALLDPGGGAGQAHAILEMMRRHEEATRRCRLRRLPPEVAQAQGLALRRESTGESGAGGGGSVAWVAPVRKRLETGVHWRPPDVRQGVRFTGRLAARAGW